VAGSSLWGAGNFLLLWSGKSVSQLWSAVTMVGWPGHLRTSGTWLIRTTATSRKLTEPGGAADAP
jgi:hypothetical protein